MLDFELVTDEQVVRAANDTWLKETLIDRFQSADSVRERHEILAILGSISTLAHCKNTTTSGYKIHEDTRNYWLAALAPDRVLLEFAEADASIGVDISL